MLKKILLTLLLVSSLFAMDTRLNSYPQGKEYYEAAERGDPDAMFNLGLVYKNFIKDYQESLYWYEKAYKRGASGAAHNLGILYKESLKDYKKAEEWYLKAIEQNDKDTPAALGLLYKNHFKDYPKAIKWYKKAYEIGDMGGALGLGYLYDVTLKNTKEGIKWYKKAAQGGHANAINNLNKTYANQGNPLLSAAYVLAMVNYGYAKEEVFNHLKDDRKLSDEEIKKAYQLQKTLDIPKHYYDAELEENPTSKTTNPRGQR
jgi:TPR repeat protein